jgi:copper chaperone
MNTEETVLRVHGMHCQSCVRHVDGALRRIAGISSVRVDLAAGEVRVQCDPARTSRREIVEAIAAVGYDVEA